MLEAIAGYDPLDTNCVDWPVERYAQTMHAKTPTQNRCGAPNFL
jgi:hypothetical protein